VEQFNHSFKVVHALPCDVPLGDHPSEFRMLEKYPALEKTNAQKNPVNPYIDASGCLAEADIEEAMFHAILQEQQQKQ
jgi:hypothetical protein